LGQCVLHHHNPLQCNVSGLDPPKRSHNANVLVWIRPRIFLPGERKRLLAFGTYSQAKPGMTLAFDGFSFVLYCESEAAKFVNPRGVLRGACCDLWQWNPRAHRLEQDA
jgi:hypothetical protein